MKWFGFIKNKKKNHQIFGVSMKVANMAPFTISSSLILVIYDNMINRTNHII
jgi:hypothetical protein